MKQFSPNSLRVLNSKKAYTEFENLEQSLDSDNTPTLILIKGSPSEINTFEPYYYDGMKKSSFAKQFRKAFKESTNLKPKATLIIL